MRQSSKTTIRTVVQSVIACALALPVIVESTGLDVAWPWLAAAVGTVAAVAGTVARVMALPSVQLLLDRYGLGTDLPDGHGGVDRLARRSRE
ncbi:hypothetical protein RM572_00315 [Streptomyces sp. DSM 42041]|uniref:Holin n=1 Tax=Streptomyces hazeniae TaxID=3075538 RepID=A0ABU2NJQ1_9ACTN|nr:hypothetical protein [Streptomyces sp. DSM 42041]MDT0377219.1 hypothetical protein [Streptomyces sp. DSM 42041]